ncbi:metal-dependent hydrolase family protein [Sphingosinicella rhizophila]|uniref:Amidohydrolase family protein n=1 Tax=Sphingosinicella rhizophila TaxID=3050082 RepID=A0ABU3Q211_9SPHN|nr:amidohydrolase family protein [Sphingosinicella sp. GR2756]MDT9597456.1 amidohydrolase family protein [Sphingosinicella sp. GR2756]
MWLDDQVMRLAARGCRIMRQLRLHIVVPMALLGAGSVAVLASGPPPASGTVVLRAARMFDGTSERLREDAVIVVRGGKIVSVGGNPEIPAGADIVDLGDATLLPGFIDAHAHLTLEPDSDYYRKAYNELMRTQSEQAFYAAVNARKTLEGGFTTVRHVGARYFIDVGLRNAIDAGLTPGPHMLTAGNAITARGGSCDQAPFPPERVPPKTVVDGVCSGPGECREAVRSQIKWGASVIKLCVSGGVLSHDPVDVPQLTAEEMKAAIEEAHNWGRKVAAHAHGDTAARMAVEAGVDSIEHGSFLSEETLSLMKKKGVFLVPTITALDWVSSNAGNYPPNIAEKARVAGAASGAMFRSALRLGVPIALGTDITVRPNDHGKNAMEFVLMVRHGMRPAAALLAGTREAARLLGLERDIGTLETGKTADIVAVAGNPIADIGATGHPVLVMQAGRLVTKRP